MKCRIVKHVVVPHKIFIDLHKNKFIHRLSTKLQRTDQSFALIKNQNLSKTRLITAKRH